MNNIDEDIFEAIIKGPYIPWKSVPTTTDPSAIELKPIDE